MLKMSNTEFYLRINVLVVIVFLSSCATNGIADFRSIGMNKDVVTEPTIRNGYQGVLVDMSGATLSDLNNRAKEICGALGGAKSLPYFSHSVPIGWELYRYSCNGLENLTPTLRVIATPATTLNAGTENQETEKEKNSLKQEQNNQAEQNATTPNTTKKTLPLNTSIAIDDAKKKCIDLGFKPSTERFGQCVLRLSK
jgi:hypothetical protein